MLICQWHLDVAYGKQGEADALAPCIVPGTQHWMVYRVLE